MNLDDIIHEKESGITIPIILKPNAKSNAICEVSEGRLKIKVKGEAHEGKANKSLIQFIAETFNVPKNSVEIIHGHKIRKKLIMIKNINLKHALKNYQS